MGILIQKLVPTLTEISSSDTDITTFDLLGVVTSVLSATGEAVLG